VNARGKLFNPTVFNGSSDGGALLGHGLQCTDGVVSAERFAHQAAVVHAGDGPYCFDPTLGYRPPRIRLLSLKRPLLGQRDVLGAVLDRLFGQRNDLSLARYDAGRACHGGAGFRCARDHVDREFDAV
jgi:hypothetical protein